MESRKSAAVIKLAITVTSENDVDRLIGALRDIGIKTESIEEYSENETIPLDAAVAKLFPDKSSDEVTGMILKNIRVENGLTQEALAKMLSTSRTAVASMERGKRPISKAMAKKLGKVFGVAYTAFL
jgi:DNA-binding XRE family transcriptional regulator